MELGGGWRAPAPTLYDHGCSGGRVVEMSPSEVRARGEREEIREVLPIPAEREAKAIVYSRYCDDFITDIKVVQIHAGSPR